MPNSCRCILDRMVFKGAMTEEERDKILRNMSKKKQIVDEESIRADERAKTIDEIINKWCEETCGANRCIDHMDRCVFGEFLMIIKKGKING